MIVTIKVVPMNVFERVKSKESPLISIRKEQKTLKSTKTHVTFERNRILYLY